MRTKWDKKQHVFSFKDNVYTLFLSKPCHEYAWYAQYKEVEARTIRNLGHYTTVAHAVRGIKRDINSRRKRAK